MVHDRAPAAIFAGCHELAPPCRGRAAERDLISSSHDDAGLVCFIDKALEAERELERHFWIDAAAEVVLASPPTRRRALFERAARRIHTSYRVPHGRRRSTTRALAGMILPLV